MVGGRYICWRASQVALVVKNPAWQAGDVRDAGSAPRSPGAGVAATPSSRAGESLDRSPRGLQSRAKSARTGSRLACTRNGRLGRRLQNRQTRISVEREKGAGGRDSEREARGGEREKGEERRHQRELGQCEEGPPRGQGPPGRPLIGLRGTRWIW